MCINYLGLNLCLLPSTRMLQPLSSVTSKCTPVITFFPGNGFSCQIMRLSTQQFLDWIFWETVFRFLKHNGIQMYRRQCFSRQNNSAITYITTKLQTGKYGPISYGHLQIQNNRRVCVFRNILISFRYGKHRTENSIYVHHIKSLLKVLAKDIAP